MWTFAGYKQGIHEGISESQKLNTDMDFGLLICMCLLHVHKRSWLLLDSSDDS